MRLPKLSYDKLTPRQKEVYDKHVVRRNYVTGPYNVWIHSPELFEKVSAISNFMRFDCALPVKLREFGILVTPATGTRSLRGTRTSTRRWPPVFPKTSFVTSPPGRNPNSRPTTSALTTTSRWKRSRTIS